MVPGVGIAEACPLARLYDEMPNKVFFAPSSLIDTLNDKNEFFKLAKEYDTDRVAVPHTTKIHDPEELTSVLAQLKKTEHPSAEFFIKRIADSRNRERDTRRGTAAGLDGFTMLPNEPYVLQPFIEGKEYTATFSVDNGVMTSLVVSNGEMVNMTYYNCPQHAGNITAWLEDFLAGINYNGWGSIDLIHREVDNKLFVLEFNPRLHSCAVLFNEETVTSLRLTRTYQTQRPLTHHISLYRSGHPTRENSISRPQTTSPATGLETSCLRPAWAANRCPSSPTASPMTSPCFRSGTTHGWSSRTGFSTPNSSWTRTSRTASSTSLCWTTAS